MSNLERRFLGRTGLRVSSLTLGTMNFGGRTSVDESEAVIDRALDAGINILDTANVYNMGRSEEIVGAALKCSSPASPARSSAQAHASTWPTTWPHSSCASAPRSSPASMR